MRLRPLVSEAPVAGFLIVARMGPTAVRYIYNDAVKALAKLRTLQRNSIPFELRDADTERPLEVQSIEALVSR